MKKLLMIILSCLLLFSGLFFLLNVTVTTRQGINYRWHTIKLPLYLKILDFFDRHYNYKALTSKIISGASSQEEKVMRIFRWTHKNIRKAPKGLPVVDDHVWHIIIRGYGTNDQSADVFSTLCNYAQVDAFFDFVYSKEGKGAAPLAFVKLNNSWKVFDPYNGVYFKNRLGEFADIGQIRKGESVLASIGDTDKRQDGYRRYIGGISLPKDMGFKKANIQSPLRRLLYEIKKVNKLLNRDNEKK